jgi:signal transduction histidine kinase
VLKSYRSLEGCAEAREIEKESKLDFLLEDTDSLLEDNKEGIFRIRDIVKNLKDFTSIDFEGKLDYSDLNKALKNTLLIAKNEIKYVADVETDFGKIPPAYCNVNEISQAVLNILINAAHAVKEKKSSEKGIIKIRTYDDGDYVSCDISDNGTGIPDDVKKRIFDPFFTTKQAGKGTGLGLTVTYDIIVNRHKGAIAVESEKGKGTVFTIRLRKNE